MKNTLTVILCLITINCYAGFNGYTNHSRANCVNNESISWDLTHNWTMDTISEHFSIKTGALIHTIDTGFALGHRSAAVHWGEGFSGGWRVVGFHYRLTADGVNRLEQEDWVEDCSIYDGWWAF